MKKQFLFLIALGFSAWAMAQEVTFEKVGDFGYVNRGAVVAIDLNKDGYPSVLYMERASNKRSIFVENNAGTLTVHSYGANAGLTDLSIPFYENPGMVVMDVNKDGFQDLVVAGGWPSKLEVYLNNGTGGLVKDDTQTNLQGARDYDNSDFLTAGDFDKDGWTDLFVLGLTYDVSTAQESLKMSIYRNNNGVFEAPDQTLPGCRGGSIAVGDVNKDGFLDIFYTGYGSGYEAHLYYGDGAGNWTAEAAAFDALIKGDVAIIDFDDDGNRDIIVQGRESVGTVIYQNNGDGTFTKKDNTVTGLHASNDLCISYGDFNFDGKMDIIASAWDIFSGATCLFLNNGDFTFTKQALAEEARGGDVFAWDYNKDGKPDYAVWNYSDSKSWNAPIVKNTTPGTPTAIEEINTKAKAVKAIRDGQIIIIREGKSFNALGTEVK